MQPHKIGVASSFHTYDLIQPEFACNLAIKNCLLRQKNLITFLLLIAMDKNILSQLDYACMQKDVVLHVAFTGHFCCLKLFV